MKIKRHIPNFITSLNLLCGCLAIFYAFHDHLAYASWLIGLAAIFDFLDGMAARLLKVHSDIGKELDSLADVVTFGVVPGVIMFQLLQFSIHNGDANTILLIPNRIIQFLPFIIPIFSALRLAKFNIDTRQSDSFIGLPTPANALLIGSFPLIIQYQSGQLNLFCSKIIYNPYFILVFSIVMSLLLVAELPLFALKFKNLSWPDNKIRFIFLGASLLLLIIFHFIAVSFIIFLYIILSVIVNYNKKKPIENTNKKA